MSTQTLRVLSWNIQDGLLRPEVGQDVYLKETLSEFKPAVVALLEYKKIIVGADVPEPVPSANMLIDALMADTGYHLALLHNFSSFKGKGATQFTITIGAIYYLPALVTLTPKIASTKAYSGHALLEAVLASGERARLAVVHNHHATDGENWERLKRMLKYWNARSNHDQPLAVIGDFNRQPHEWGNLTGYINSGWLPPTDALLHEVSRAQPGMALATHKRTLVEEARRIDYALAKHGCRLPNGNFRHLVAARGSDHIPIMADFEIS